MAISRIVIAHRLISVKSLNSFLSLFPGPSGPPWRWPCLRVHIRRLLLVEVLSWSEVVWLHDLLLKVLLAQRLNNYLKRLSIYRIQANLFEGALIGIVQLLALLELVDFFKLMMNWPASRWEISVLILLASNRVSLLLEDSVPLADPCGINDGSELGVVAHMLLIVVMRGVCVLFVATSSSCTTGTY